MFKYFASTLKSKSICAVFDENTEMFTNKNLLPLLKADCSKLKTANGIYFSFDTFSIPFHFKRNTQPSHTASEKSAHTRGYGECEKKVFTKSVACFAPFVKIEIVYYFVYAFISLYFGVEMCT